MSKRTKTISKSIEKITKNKADKTKKVSKKNDDELVLSDLSEEDEIILEPIEKTKKYKSTKETGTQDITKYQKLDHVDQILTRSETYIGSTNKKIYQII